MQLTIEPFLSRSFNLAHLYLGLLHTCFRSSTGSVFQHQMEITEPSKTGQPTRVIQIQDLKRLENWILALKLRYRIDFGQRKKYNVEWIHKLDSSSDLVEIII